jgi:hypothetical protein
MTSQVQESGRSAHVARFLERLGSLTPSEWATLRGATAPLRRPLAGRMRAAAALVRAVLHAPAVVRRPQEVDALWHAVDDAVARGTVPDENRDLAVHAGLAVMLEDVLPPKEFQQWYGPFEQVIPRASL